MLRSLEIQNFVLIDHLSISFLGGLSVITGETGAGKSIIMGALGLLLGQKADLRLIRQGQKKCVVEGIFDTPKESVLRDVLEDEDALEDAKGQDTLILRREVCQDGRSRAFLNDSPVQVAVLKALASTLVDIHSQHQNLLLGKEDFQMRILDCLSKSQPLLDSYRLLHDRCLALDKQIRGLQESLQNKEQLQDLTQFQLEELQKARLLSGEQESLEAEQQLLEHATEVKGSLYQARMFLGEDEVNVLGVLLQALGQIRQAERHLPSLDQTRQRLESAYVELKDLSGEVERMEEDVECSPERLEAVSDRLSLIYRLEKKHRLETVDQLLELQRKLKDSVEGLEEDRALLESLSRERQDVDSKRREAAALLTLRRQSCLPLLEERMLKSLAFLGMPNAAFKVAIEPSDLSSSGADSVRFLFSANPATPPRDISQVASGGEISRLMLSLKCLLQGREHMPTVIFDEIDTGTGGEMAARMAVMMKRMSEGDAQVICITHLPQIACHGKHHYLVAKSQDALGSLTSMVKLDEGQRVGELARMLSGENLTQAAYDNARALLEHAGQ